MPESRRSSVDFPAPLWPTSPTRSPRSNDMVMSRNASMTTTLEALRTILPPRKVFFSERDLASKMRNSTHALCVSMYGRWGLVTCCRLEVLPGARTPGPTGPADTRGQRALSHLLQLRTRGHLLGEQRGLDAVEQPLQPADQLSLRDPQLGIRRNGALSERQGETVEFVTQFRRQPFFEFADAGGVDLAQPVAGGVVERGRPYLLEQLFDHGADPHHLGRLLDEVGQRPVIGVVILRGRHQPRVKATDDFDVVVVAVTQCSHSPCRWHLFMFWVSGRHAIRRSRPHRCRRSSPTTSIGLLTLVRRAP